MKKTELISSLKVQRSQNGILFLVAYIAGMLLFTPFLGYLNDNTLYVLIWIPAFFGYLIVFPIAWTKIRGGNLNKPKCVACGTKLDQFQIQIIIASNNCPICGELAIEDAQID